MKNHLGSYECKLCLTLHNTEGNYLAHTQGKRHQQNLARRAFKDARDAPILPTPAKYARKDTPSRSGGRATRSRSRGMRRPVKELYSLRSIIRKPMRRCSRATASCPRTSSASSRRTRTTSTYYLRVVYETIGFKVPNDAVDKGEDRFHELHVVGNAAVFAVRGRRSAEDYAGAWFGGREAPGRFAPPDMLPPSVRRTFARPRRGGRGSRTRRGTLRRLQRHSRVRGADDAASVAPADAGVPVGGKVLRAPPPTPPAPSPPPSPRPPSLTE